MYLALYKKYFSVEVNYQVDSSTSAEGLMIIPSSSTLDLMNNHNLGYKSFDGSVLLYFQGTPDQTDSSKIIPQYILDDNQSLFFKLYLSDVSLLNSLNLFPDSSNISFGFPQIYIGKKPDSTTNTVTLEYQKISLKPVIFSFRIKDTDCGLISVDEASWEIKNNDGVLISENIAIKDNEGNFNCSVNLSNQQPDIYSFIIGSSTTIYFVDTYNEFKDCIAVIQISKNSFLSFDNNWLDTNYVKFTNTIIQN